jgi:hypothetical protein
MSAEKQIKIPLQDVEKAILAMGFVAVKTLLEDTDNPLTKALHTYVFKEDKSVEDVYKFIDKCDAYGSEDTWTGTISEIMTYYVIVDLVGRTFRSGYLLENVLMENGVDFKGFDTEEEYNNTISTAILVIDKMLFVMSGLKTIEYIAWYAWRSERMPDPMTGISHKLASYNYVPNIPQNPPQLIFSDYDDGHLIEYSFRKNDHLDWIKNLNCLRTLALVLNDEENPPAKIMSAYFPELENEILTLLSKFMKIHKDGRRSKIKLTCAEFGLLYACTDLFGRLSASAYRHILKDIEKDRMIPLPKEGSEEKKEVKERSFEDREEHIAFLTGVVDEALKSINEQFGDLKVIKAYRSIAAQLLWFDDGM